MKTKHHGFTEKCICSNKRLHSFSLGKWKGDLENEKFIFQNNSQFNQTWCKAFFCWRKYKFVLMKSYTSFSGEIEGILVTVQNLLLQNTGPTSTKAWQWHSPRDMIIIEWFYHDYFLFVWFFLGEWRCRYNERCTVGRWCSGRQCGPWAFMEKYYIFENYK